LQILDEASETMKVVGNSQNPRYEELKKYIEYLQRVREFEDNVDLSEYVATVFESYELSPDAFQDCVGENENVAPIFVEEEYCDNNPVIWEF